MLSGFHLIKISRVHVLHSTSIEVTVLTRLTRVRYRNYSYFLCFLNFLYFLTSHFPNFDYFLIFFITSLFFIISLLFHHFLIYSPLPYFFTTSLLFRHFLTISSLPYFFVTSLFPLASWFYLHTTMRVEINDDICWYYLEAASSYTSAAESIVSIMLFKYSERRALSCWECLFPAAGSALRCDTEEYTSIIYYYSMQSNRKTKDIVQSKKNKNIRARRK